MIAALLACLEIRMFVNALAWGGKVEVVPCGLNSPNGNRLSSHHLVRAERGVSAVCLQGARWPRSAARDDHTYGPPRCPCHPGPDRRGVSPSRSAVFRQGTLQSRNGNFQHALLRFSSG